METAKAEVLAAFTEAATELQGELVQQWLQELSLDERERCWHEVRAVEAVMLRLLGTARNDEATAEMARRLEIATWGKDWTGAVQAVREARQ